MDMSLHITIAVIVVERSLKIVCFTPQAEQFIGMDKGCSFPHFLLKLKHKESEKQIVEAIEDMRPVAIQTQTVDGHWYLIGVEPHMVRDICTDRAVITISDIDNIRQFESNLSETISRVNAILDNTFDAIVTCDDSAIIRSFNPAAERIFGHSAEEALGMDINTLLEEPFLLKGEEVISEHLSTGKARIIPGGFEITGRRKDGSSFPSDVVISELWQIGDKSGEEHLYICVFRDISERKHLEEAIIYQAHHDALTGLPNRVLFKDHLASEMSQSQRNRKKLAVLFLDLDRFKNINDTLGHAIGDQFLKEVAYHLRDCVRESDTVARIGGDEFNILLTDLAHADDIITIAQKITGVFKESYRVREHELFVTCSVGISVYPDDAVDVEILLRNADIAMYHAKEQGGNNYQFYSPSMNIRTVERIRFENSLRQALERDELTVFYQPQFTIETHQLVCAEALVRWRHSELGLLEPKRFISLAEEIGILPLIDEWVLRVACVQFKQWREAGLPHLCVAVNLSAKQFQKADLVERVAQILEDTGLDPQSLNLEITESTAMKNLELTIPNMAKLAEMGVGICIDDFGTGYSSLNYLKKLPIHKLKIDQSFVKDIATDLDDRTIVKAVTNLAQNMKLRVIAEGVETGEQLEFLKSIGCHEIQGYLVSKPLPAEELEDFVLSKG